MKKILILMSVSLLASASFASAARYPKTAEPDARAPKTALQPVQAAPVTAARYPKTGTPDGDRRIARGARDFGYADVFSPDEVARGASDFGVALVRTVQGGL